MEKHLREFYGKELNFFLDLALYQKVYIDLGVEIEEETEPLFQHESSTEPYAVVNHNYFKGSKDVESLRKIFFSDINDFHYCPSCDMNVPITFEGIRLDENYKYGNEIFFDAVDISSEEEYRSAYSHAEKECQNKFDYLIGLLFKNNRIIPIELECTAKGKHKFNVFFQLTEDNCLIKVGQIPSIASFDNSNNRYKKVIKDKDILRELNKAIGLKAHAVGIGSYVYLRRIFEKLIYGKFEEFLRDNTSFKQDDFFKMKMNEKVSLLKDYLPNNLVNNRHLYGILSKGIHELSEKKCLEYFDEVYAAIVVILEEILEIEEKNKREKELQKALQSIKSNLE
ncbi:hypothetical protein [Priestia aryabhattai]|uniref:hypothetical protein n=1 Tax=Priestia aryabhattai TaxID=412384 RepID=UPI001C8D0111|nr:hypothetical protein [Priestia aryabhattai]MBX9996069.1 hypothetical protein [Priestia aryabhattai]